MPKRPTVTTPKFGEWLELQRGERSLEQIAIQVRKHVKSLGMKIGPSLIFKIEHGRVPSWPLLVAFSESYTIPIEEMARRLIAALEYPGVDDLLRHGRTKQSGSPLLEGETDVPASAREQIADLERQIADYKTRLSEVQDIASRLVKLAALGSTQERASARDKSARRRRDRKTG